MAETFRLRRFYRNLGIVGLVFSGCLLLLFVCCFVWRPVQGPDDWLAILFMTGIFAANAAMFTWPLLGYARGSLTISEASLVAMLILPVVILVICGKWLLIGLPEIRQQRRDYQRNVAAAAEEWERLEREGGSAI